MRKASSDVQWQLAHYQSALQLAICFRRSTIVESLSKSRPVPDDLAAAVPRAHCIHDSVQYVFVSGAMVRENQSCHYGRSFAEKHCPLFGDLCRRSN